MSDRDVVDAIDVRGFLTERFPHAEEWQISLVEDAVHNLVTMGDVRWLSLWGNRQYGRRLVMEMLDAWHDKDEPQVATETPQRDIVDDIDALVEDSLDNYDQRSGYDYNVNQDRCPHEWCSEPWHGLAITQKMREMRSRWGSAVHYYEDEQRVPDEVAAELDAYRYDQDDSPVLCPGSTFEGEFEPPEPEYPRWYTPGFLARLTPSELYNASILRDGWTAPAEFQFPQHIVRTWTSAEGWREIGTIDRDAAANVMRWGSDEPVRVIPMPQLETSEPAGEPVTPSSLDDWRFIPIYDESTAEGVNNALGATGEEA
jgi:hypothetical protein